MSNKTLANKRKNAIVIFSVTLIILLIFIFISLKNIHNYNVKNDSLKSEITTLEKDINNLKAKKEKLLKEKKDLQIKVDSLNKENQ